MSRRRSRYIGIFRGGRAEEIDRLIGYLRGTNRAVYPERQGNRPDQQRTFARPFLEGVGSNFYLEAASNLNRWGTISGALGTRVKTTITGSETAFKIPNFYNPRAVFTYGISGTGAPRVSQITGRSYKSYGGDSAVSQFGLVAAGDTPESEFAAIKTAFTTGQTNRRVSYIPPSY
ncbi:hypothetical protein HPC62_00015 [Thermoleptolyngbya sichuanensis A183]|uniref:Uncharacterized protein n=1 Tax=Thermoleptolyngbya sichuanensis A183 TaxID=2737172 RepID=A0A6M8B434_9CYAN|nr:hypothetical protein [Thermoleptolyngbya sichuanensis]QKD80772.1 hypothetical protein HPC62_00015 [Thermoleptolyngbya sichuanensis A183]